LNISR